MKCSDLDDAAVLFAVHKAVEKEQCWAFTEAVAEQFPDVPFKVVLRKLSKLDERGLVTGCDCGCRGDWELTMQGAGLINVVPFRPNPCVRDWHTENALWNAANE